MKSEPVQLAMTPARFKRWQKRLGLSNTQAAHVLRVKERQVYCYRSGETALTPQTAFLCECIEQLVTLGALTLPGPMRAAA